MIRAEQTSDKEVLKKVYDIRREVFIDEQNVPEEEEYDQYEDSSYHFVAWDDQVPCGAARWRETADGIKLERFAVIKSRRGKGVGSALVKAVLEHVASLPDTEGKKLYLNAQVSAMPLYAKFDFNPEGERFMECDIEHQKMVR
ncbi:GNAT family N-acetyltransferase [Fulvivirga sediminis]|uniref:GNAT family N-acetyltransferase n=1 Tax=Fulvivirga sediminis TaxID=2803949 RepID=A0A937FDP9_9BACT|nr:GNAT family N-acetyltransferase [Fulvivirga sediminis]MBL3658518.1 GNAT family N-acetyltransferase [Fulvivirga sediminis]